MSEPKNLYLIDFSELNLFNLNKQLDLIKNQFKIKISINFKLLNLVDKKNLGLFFDEISLSIKVILFFIVQLINMLI